MRNQETSEAPSAEAAPPSGPRTWLDLAREVFPDKPDDYLDFVLWEQTGFPEFWHTDDPIAECKAQMERYRDFGPACYRCGQYGTGNHGKPWVKYRGGIPFCRPCIPLMEAEFDALDASNASLPAGQPQETQAAVKSEQP